MNDDAQALERLRRAFPWPAERPDVRPLRWIMDGGGKELVIEQIERRHARVLLEIGVFFGGSLERWLAASPELTVIAVDDWRGRWWADYAVEHGRAEYEAQLRADDGPFQTFLATFWEQRHRIIPIRERAPGALRHLAEAGVQPEVVFIDADKDGANLEQCHALFPGCALTGDDWNWGEGAPMQRMVRAFAERHGLYPHVDLETWALCERPPRPWERPLARRARRRLRATLGL